MTQRDHGGEEGFEWVAMPPGGVARGERDVDRMVHKHVKEWDCQNQV